MFYGNSAVTASQQNPTGVWDSNYIGVWHLPNGATLSANDSTANGNNGTISGATATAGEIDGGASFNGSSSYIAFGTNITTEQMSTVSLWAYINTLRAAQEMVSHSAVSQGVEVLVYNNSICAYVMGSSTSDLCSTNGAKAPGWNHIVPTQGGPSAPMNLYINGADAGGATTPASISNPPNLDFGLWANASGRYFDGTLDEVRISSTVRSADWIAAEYNNQSSPATFYAVYPENTETVTPSSVTLYASQSRQFTAFGQCGSAVTWSTSPALGSLTASGFYTAPVSIATPQYVTITAASPSSQTQPGSAIVTLLPAPQNPTLTLAAFAQPPYVTGSSQQFTATLKNQDGTPIADVPVAFTISGANNNSGSGTTDDNGVAEYTYTGANSGTDTIHMSANNAGTQVASNSLTATWVAPVAAISTTTALGRFFPWHGGCCFSASPSDTPLFVQAFPTINFNPPSGAIPGNTAVNVNTRPFTTERQTSSQRRAGARAMEKTWTASTWKTPMAFPTLPQLRRRVYFRKINRAEFGGRSSAWRTRTGV